jgi:alpha-methylacyl-CoA racemase
VEITMGPLAGIRVVEVASIGPGPFCGMMLSDMGAEVLSIDRNTRAAEPTDPLQRNRHRLALDLKSDAGRNALLSLVERADVIFEGYRPGVAERLGFGPQVCLQRNARLVYGRMTGWGQEGPLARVAGHDINYIALSGALHSIGRRGEKPTPPLNLVGDFGGGAMLLAFGIVCALLETQRSGKGQVVDAAMIDGSAALMAMFIAMQPQGRWNDAAGSNVLSGAAHYYDTYQTRDGRFISIGALEPQFYSLLIEKAGLDEATFAGAGMTGPSGYDAQLWSTLKAKLTEVFKTRTRDEWCSILEGTDVCFAPVLSLSEAPHHHHHRARGTFVEVAGHMQNAPAPRFSRTPAATPQPSRQNAEELPALMSRWGFDATTVSGVLAAAIVDPNESTVRTGGPNKNRPA